jgi:hypothetical protein
VKLRLELVSLDSEPEEIAITHVYYRGNTWAGATMPGGRPIEVAPNRILTVFTADPRAAIGGVVFRVPDPVPTVLVGHVLAASDPRLASRLVVEIVDEKTRAPIPHATVQFEQDDRPTVEADEAGRFVFYGDDGRAAKPPLFQWLFHTSRSVHARGYVADARSHGIWGPPSDKDAALRGFPEEELRDWLEHGVLRLALEPLGDGWREWEVRLLDAKGKPAAALLVLPSAPYPKALGAAVTAREVFAGGMRRTTADGLVSFPVREGTSVVGLDVAMGGRLVAAYLLHVGGWPASGPRELRLPALAEVEVVLEGAPTDTEIAYFADPLGWARAPADGPAFPLTEDPEARRIVEERRLAVCTGIVELHGTLSAGVRTLAFPMPVGTTKSVWIGDQPAFSIQAATAGPLRRVVKWQATRAGEK